MTTVLMKVKAMIMLLLRLLDISKEEIECSKPTLTSKTVDNPTNITNTASDNDVVASCKVDYASGDAALQY